LYIDNSVIIHNRFIENLAAGCFITLALPQDKLHFVISSSSW